MPVVGVCKLCHEKAELQDSHFLPAWLYKLCRDVENNKHPVTIAGGVAKQTSNQASDHVLCHNCEERFNVRGEEWLHTRVATPDGFAIQQILKAAEPKVSGEKLALYAGAEIPALDMDQLAYFGLSVFWRSSAHAWPDPNQPGRKMLGINLGPYEESLRLFLLDKGPFPKTASIIVSVWPYDKQPPIAFNTPVSANKGAFHSHMFYVPGIDFKFVAGKALPEEIHHMCAQTSPNRAILSSVLGADAILDAYVANVKKSVPVGKLAAQFNKK
ncbi:MAG: hypothetical protein WB987_08385 [Candidatus Acidiferrales bacterium]